MAFWDNGANAMLLLPGWNQAPLWVLHVEDFIPVVWSGGSSFFTPHPESFTPSENTVYFNLRPSRSVQNAWYVWVPAQHRERIRVNGQAVGDDPQIIRDADVISVRPPKPREENLPISFFLPSPFLRHYTPAETLRCGIMSRTYVCHPRGDPDRNYAVKIVRASRFPDIRSFEDSTRRECNIVGFLGRQGGHPHIVQLRDICYTPTSAYIVTEQPGRYLDNILSERRKRRRRLAICEVRDYARGICSATMYLHSLGIVLRNLSIKNIYIYHGDIPKLSDFTAADYLPLAPGGITGLINAKDHLYLAPEALQGADQNEKVDCWSVGMILKALLFELPVGNDVLEGELHAKTLPLPTIDLVSRLLIEDPQYRLSMAAALMHPWFHE